MAAPTLTGTSVSLPSVNVNTTQPGGDTVENLFASAYNDDGAFMGGIAVIANTADDTTQGVWQFSSDNQTTWIDMNVGGTTISAGNALTIAKDSYIRFVPVNGYTGTPTGLTVHALDDDFAVGGGSFSLSDSLVTPRSYADTTTNGGNTAISAESISITLDIVASGGTDTGSGGGGGGGGGGNSAPTIANVPASDTVDISATEAIDLSGVTFADVDVGDTLQVTLSVDVGTIASTDGNGTTSGVTIVGSGSTSMTLEGSASDINSYLDTTTVIAYTAPGTGSSATLTIGVTDGALSASNETLSITLNTPEADVAPTISATGATPTFNGTPVDLFSSVTVDTQNTSQTITAITLTIDNVTDGSDEVLTLDGEDLALTNGNTGTTTASSLAYNIVLAGTDITLELTGMTLSEAETQTLIDGLAYKNTATSPTAATRTFTIFDLTDSGNPGGGANSSTPNLQAVVTVAANGLPTLTNAPTDLTVVEETAGNVDLSAATFADPNNDSLTVTLTLNTGTFATPADGSTVGGGVTETLVSATEITLVGSAADIMTYLDTPSNIQYTGATNVSGDNAATMTIQVSDGTDTLSAPVTVNLDITDVNDEPIVTSNGTNNSFTEGGSAALAFTGTSIDPVETGQKVGNMNLTVENVTDGADEKLTVDGLTFDLVNGFGGQTTNGFMYSVVLNGTTATVSIFNKTIPATDLEAVVNSIAYSNTSDNPTTTNPRVITLTSLVDEGRNDGANDSTVALNISSSISIIGTDDAPTLTTTGSDPTFTEDASAVALFTSTAASTVDSGQTITGLTLTVTNVTDTNEQLFIDGTTFTLADGNGTTIANNIAYSVAMNGTTATVTLSGTALSEADANTLIDAITYSNTSNAPTTGSSRVVTITDITDSGTTKNSTSGLTHASTVTVAGVNDAPVASGNASLASILEDATDPSGATISSTLANSFTDPDGTDTLAGIAVVGNTANAGTEGTWQYSSNNGGSWSLIGLVADDATALALSASTLLRFVPASNFNGTATQLDVRLLDSTYAGSFSDTARGGGTVRVDTSTNGGITAISSSTVSIDQTVTAVDDTPTLTTMGDDPTYVEGASAVSLFSSASASTVESGQTITGLTLTVTNITESNKEQLFIDGTTFALEDGGNGTTLTNSIAYVVSTTGSTATVTLSGASLSEADLNTLIDGITYRNTSETLTGSDRIVTITGVTDSGTTNNSTTGLTLASTVTLTDVNDPPTMTVSALDPAFATGSNAVSVFEDAAISTVESGQLISQVRITVTNVTDTEVLIIDGATIPLTISASGTTDNFNYAVSGSGTTLGVALTSTTATTAITQAAINGMTYQNTSASPTAADRVITVTNVVDDGGTANSGNATATLNLTSTVTVVDDDTPVAEHSTRAATIDQAFAFSASDFNVTQETNGVDALEYVTVTSVVGGVLLLFGAPIGGTATDTSTLAGAGTLSTGDKVNVADLSLVRFTPTSGRSEDASVGFTVTDAGGQTSPDATVTVTLSPAPTVTPTPSPAPSPTPTPVATTEPVVTELDGGTLSTSTRTNSDGTTTRINQVSADDGSVTFSFDDGSEASDDGSDADVTPTPTVTLPQGVGLTAEKSSLTGSSTNELNSQLQSLVRSSRQNTEENGSTSDGGSDEDASPSITQPDSSSKAASTFLDTLGGTTTLDIRTIVPTTTGSGFFQNDPIVISGNPSTARPDAMIINTSNLPRGSTLQLDNIEFASVQGSATIIGGSGSNYVSGDASTQFISLGVDDDHLFGGGGNDTIGSAGGDDYIYGNAGDDLIFGGEGADQLHGGAGTDTATYTGDRNDYLIEQEGGIVTVTSLSDESDTDRLINVEHIQFADQTLDVTYDQELTTLATLYEQVLGRVADIDGLQFWANAGNGNSTVSGNMVYAMLTTQEVTDRLGSDITTLSGEAAIGFLYEAIFGRVADSAGLAYWAEFLNNGANIADISAFFANSVEFAGQARDSTQWEFFD